MISRASAADTKFLLRLLEEGYEKTTWHGPNLKQALRGVSAKVALWRPQRGRHNVWELAVHAAYWKYVVRQRLLGERQGSFVVKGSNWFTAPETAGEAEWRNIRQLLEDEHQKLVHAVADPLHSRAVRKQTRMLLGAAFHDIYHAGQIRLVRRLCEAQESKA